MLNKFINDRVYYKIFDKSYKQSSYIYSKYKYNDELLLQEVENNKKAILSTLGADNIVILKQVHGNKIIDADEINDFNIELEADGAVTTLQNLALGIQTADCVPILLASDDGNVIGAAHAGWKGSKTNIVSNLVKAMEDKGTNNIKALIGPAIQQYSYEVDANYYESFISEDLQFAKFFIPSPQKPADHYMFDLPAFVEMKLKNAGVEDISKSLDNTYSNKDKYPSYRRSTHLGTKYNKNILSTIVIKG